MARKTKEEIIYGNTIAINAPKARDSKEYDALLFDFIEKEITASLDEENK